MIGICLLSALALGKFSQEGLSVFESSGDAASSVLHLKDDDKGKSNGLASFVLPPETLARVRGKPIWLVANVRQGSANSPAAVGLELRADGPTPQSAQAVTGTQGEMKKRSLRAKLTVPSDARRVRVLLKCADGWFGTGEAWFSDLLLTDEAKDLPKLVVVPAREQMDFAYRTPSAAYTDEERAYRDGCLAQKQVTKDPRPRPEVRHGTWYQDGHHVFWLGGWLHGERTTDWPEKDPDRQGVGHFAYALPPGKACFDRLGFNSSQISHAPVQAGKALMGLPLPKKDPKRRHLPDRRETEARDAAFLRGFGDLPMVVDFAYGFAADVPAETHAVAGQRNSLWHLFLPFCPEHPEGDRYYSSYFRGGTSTLMRYGMNVFIYELFNESSYDCACAANVQRFAAEMKRRYGTIGKANATWGTDFDSFLDVASRTDFRPEKGAYYDWCEFIGRRYAELLKKYRGVVRSVDGRDCVYFTEQSAGEPPYRPGIDYRKVADALDVLTLEGGWKFGDERHSGKHLFTLDFYRALSKNVKPVMNNEHYCARFEDGKRVPTRREDIRTALWLEIMHGVSGTFFYNYDKRSWEWKTAVEAKNQVEKPSYKSYSLLNPHNLPPENLDVFRKFREELAPFADQLLPLPRTQTASVAVLFSYPTLWRSPAKWDRNSAVDTTRDWYMALNDAQVPVRVVFDEDIATFGPEVEVLVLPAASRCSDETVAAMRRFTARGGTIVASAEALSRTVYEKPREPTERPPMTVVADAKACAKAVLGTGLRRPAVVEPTDGGEPFGQVDAQVCSRNGLTLVTVVDMAPGKPRPARLTLDLANGMRTTREFELRPQEIFVLTLP